MRLASVGEQATQANALPLRVRPEWLRRASWLRGRQAQPPERQAFNSTTSCAAPESSMDAKVFRLVLSCPLQLAELQARWKHVRPAPYHGPRGPFVNQLAHRSRAPTRQRMTGGIEVRHR